MSSITHSRSWKIAQHLPWWALFYSLILSLISWGTLAVYRYYEHEHSIKINAGNQMYLYITLIITWLVTTRPNYALGVHDKLTDQIYTIMRKIGEIKEIDDEWVNCFVFIMTNISHHPVKHSQKKFNNNNFKNDRIKDILKRFYEFKMHQRLALPAALHGMCVFLVFIFHVFFAPIDIYINNAGVYTAIVCNYILALYTTGCLEVAIKVGSPYEDITKTDDTPAIKELQVQYTTIINSLTDDKKVDVLEILKNNYKFIIESNQHPVFEEQMSGFFDPPSIGKSSPYSKKYIHL